MTRKIVIELSMEDARSLITVLREVPVSGRLREVAKVFYLVEDVCEQVEVGLETAVADNKELQ